MYSQVLSEYRITCSVFLTAWRSPETFASFQTPAFISGICCLRFTYEIFTHQTDAPPPEDTSRWLDSFVLLTCFLSKVRPLCIGLARRLRFKSRE